MLSSWGYDFDMISICFWYDMGYDLDMVWECLRYDSLYGFDIWFGNGATFRGAPVGLLGKRNQKQQFDRFLVDFSKVFIVLIWCRYDFDMVLVLVWFWYYFVMILICFDMVSRHFPKIQPNLKRTEITALIHSKITILTHMMMSKSQLKLKPYQRHDCKTRPQPQ